MIAKSKKGEVERQENILPTLDLNGSVGKLNLDFEAMLGRRKNNNRKKLNSGRRYLKKN